MTLVSVPCAVCGGDKFRVLYESTLDITVNVESYYSSSRVHAGHPPVVACEVCGLIMSNPRDDEATIEQVYAQLSDEVYDSEDGNRRLAAAKHSRCVWTEQAPPARLLDVGCATGFFAEAACELGYQVSGTDLSHWMIQRARQRCPGAEFIEGPVESPVFDGKFDIVTMWDVLEHTHSPATMLSQVWRWLRPGGLLFMSMPNAASLPARVMGKRWVLLLREHLWYFSPLTISQLLHKQGFTLLHTRVQIVKFSLANIASRLAQYDTALSGALGRLGAAPLLRSCSVQFPMGEMIVVARKCEQKI